MIPNEEVLRSRQLAGRVQRYHTWPMLRPQSVGEHSARVATLYCELWGLPRAQVLYYCLHHDSGELAAGDTPFCAKRAVPALKEASDMAETMGRVTLGVTLPPLSVQEWQRVKIADMLETWEYSGVEMRMGNEFAETVRFNIERALERFDDLLVESVTDSEIWRRWMAVQCGELVENEEKR